MIKITKTIEWEMGHRIPNHIGKCKNPHGHHYKLELTLSGPIGSNKGSSSEGMIIDFGDISKLLSAAIYDTLDHSFMICEDDKIMSAFFKKQENFKAVIVPFIPTVENISQWCYNQIFPRIPENVVIENLRVYETPNSWADFTPRQVTYADTKKTNQHK